MRKDFISEDSHKDLNFKFKYNSKYLREIKYKRCFYICERCYSERLYNVFGLIELAGTFSRDPFSYTHFLFLKTDREDQFFYFLNKKLQYWENWSVDLELTYSLNFVTFIGYTSTGEGSVKFLTVNNI